MLNLLKNTFSNSLKQEKTYIEISSSNGLIIGKDKKSKLADVFSKAQIEIEKGVKQTKTLGDYKENFDALTQIEIDGKLLYQKYCKKTETRVLALCRFLDKYAPFFIKKYFPSLFSPARHYSATQEAFKNLSASLKIQLHSLTRLKQSAEKVLEDAAAQKKKSEEEEAARLKQLKEAEEARLLLLPKINETKRQIEKIAQEIPLLTDYTQKDKLKEFLALIKKVEDYDSSYSAPKLKLNSLCLAKWEPKEIKRVLLLVSHLNTLDISETQLTDQDLMEFKKQNLLNSVVTLKMNDCPHLKISQLKNASFQLKLDALERCFHLLHNPFLSHSKYINLISQFAEEVQYISSMTPGAPLKTFFKARILPVSVISLIVNQSRPPLYLIDHSPFKEQFEQVKNKPKMKFEFRLRKYLGKPEIINENGLKNFKGIIEIQPADLKSLNAYLITRPSTCTPCTINIAFKNPSDFNAEAAELLLQIADQIPEVNVKGAPSLNFGDLGLDFKKSSQFVEKVSVEYVENITLNYPTHDLMAFHTFKGTLNLTGEVTDALIEELIQSNTIANLKVLNLEACQNLTTDCIRSLVKLPESCSLILPENLKKGKTPFAELPVIKNPFNVFKFYHAKILRPEARKHYQGPAMWAPVFQIPLVRKGEQDVFTIDDEFMGPSSVEYWLNRRDYEQLRGPQSHVKMIFADGNQFLTDDKLVPFLRQFPEVRELSLRDCQNLTTEGIKQLIAYLNHSQSKIKKIDLTGCGGVTKEILSSPILKGKVIAEKHTLTITNDDLNRQSLEEILQNNELQNLVRIDLENCTNLTNASLNGLLRRLNNDIFCPTDKKGVTPREFTQRLNIVTLNLKGCRQITDEAFCIKDEDDNPKILLENLSHVCVEDTGITPKLQKIYPKVLFNNTLQYISYKRDNMQAAIFKELFEKDPAHYETLVDPFLEDNLNFTFKCETADGKKEFSARIHENLFDQLDYYRAHFRPGRFNFKSNFLGISNQFASPEAAKGFIDMLYGENIYKDLSWKTAAEIAVLCQPENLGAPSHYYENLLSFIHGKFNLEQAKEMINFAINSFDTRGLEIYEQRLLVMLQANSALSTQLKELLHLGHDFPALSDRVSTIETERLREEDRARSDYDRWVFAQAWN